MNRIQSLFWVVLLFNVPHCSFCQVELPPSEDSLYEDQPIEESFVSDPQPEETATSDLFPDLDDLHSHHSMFSLRSRISEKLQRSRGDRSGAYSGSPLKSYERMIVGQGGSVS